MIIDRKNALGARWFIDSLAGADTNEAPVGLQVLARLPLPARRFQMMVPCPLDSPI